jgi:hypothetical protein
MSGEPPESLNSAEAAPYYWVLSTLIEGVLRAMPVTKFKLLVATAAVAAGFSGSGLVESRAPADKWLLGALAAEEPKPPTTDRARRATRNDLTPETFAELHALIRPHDNEWRHLKVDWLTDVIAARKKAAKEDKPIIICYTGGAGYNEPLGTC